MSKNTSDFSLLEDKIGHTFKNKMLLKRALTHSSYANEQRVHESEYKDNERMEYLGDSVLSLVTSEYLFTTHPEMPEGKLSLVRAASVCEKTLAEFARKISLGSFLFLGNGEEQNNGRNRPSILSDAFEALLCAIFLDSSLDEVKKFLLPLMSIKISEIVEKGSAEDYKTSLQHIIQQERSEVLCYVTVGESGPAHQRVFEVEARLNSNVIGRGKAGSKREAEQLAAKEALTLFGK